MASDRLEIKSDRNHGFLDIVAPEIETLKDNSGRAPIYFDTDDWMAG